MFEIAFLGTSASAPSVDRGLSATLLLYKEHRFLIDCGEGTQRQLLRSGLGFRKLDKVLLTHGHLDHILGLGGLVSTFSRWESVSRVRIYGGRWALERVNDLMNVVLRGDEVDMAVELVGVSPGAVWEGDDMTISAAPVIHRGPGCYAYVFEEASRRPFLAEAAERLGVPNGPERRLLVEGQPITLADGTVVHPEQVLGPEQRGTKYVHVGDAGETSNLVEVCRGADALVIEATYNSDEEELAARFGHLTAAQAARLAVEAEVEHLFLVHISRRHSARDILREARRIFPRSTVPRDLDQYRISRDRVERVARQGGR